MLRENWNFHNDVAINFEGIAIQYFGWSGRPSKTIFDADLIEQSEFAEDMIILLRSKSEYSSEKKEIDDFVAKISPYIGRGGNTFDKEMAQQMLDEFISIFEKL